VKGLQSTRSVRVLRKFAVALLVALLFAVLGVIGGLGYRLNHLQELSFEVHEDEEWANATVSFSATYNPLLYPFYWLTRNGYINGTFSFVYVPMSDYPGEFGGPVWGMKPQDRYDYYTIEMTTWGFWPNLLTLLFITVLVEVASVRALYVALFSGILGFYVVALSGMLVGLTVGLVFVLFMVFKLRRPNILVSSPTPY
jgi:hypothetical protein